MSAHLRLLNRGAPLASDDSVAAATAKNPRKVVTRELDIRACDQKLLQAGHMRPACFIVRDRHGTAGKGSLRDSASLRVLARPAASP